jgi:tRNA G26 N,N-dimethylase Trm1
MDWHLTVNKLAEEWRTAISIKDRAFSDLLMSGETQFDIIDICPGNPSCVDWVHLLPHSLKSDTLVSLQCHDFSSQNEAASFKQSLLYASQYPSSLNSREIGIRRLYQTIDTELS